MEVSTADTSKRIKLQGLVRHLSSNRDVGGWGRAIPHGLITVSPKPHVVPPIDTFKVDFISVATMDPKDFDTWPKALVPVHCISEHLGSDY